MRLLPIVFCLISCAPVAETAENKRYRAADLNQQDLCSGELYKDIKHNICWWRSSWGNSAIGFIIPCDLYDQCAKEGYLD